MLLPRRRPFVRVWSVATVRAWFGRGRFDRLPFHDGLVDHWLLDDRLRDDRLLDDWLRRRWLRGYRWFPGRRWLLRGRYRCRRFPRCGATRLLPGATRFLPGLLDLLRLHRMLRARRVLRLHRVLRARRVLHATLRGRPRPALLVQVGVERVGIGPFASSLCAHVLRRRTLLLGVLAQAVRIEACLFGLELCSFRLRLRLLGRYLALARSQRLLVGVSAEICCLCAVVLLLLPAKPRDVLGTLAPATDGHRDDEHDDDRHYDDPDHDPDPGIHALLQFLGVPTQRDIAAYRDLNREPAR